MIARLGNVLYWIGSGTGAVISVCGAFLAVFSTPNEAALGVMIIVAGAAIAGAGRACLYVLAGR